MSRRDGFNSANNSIAPNGRLLDQRPDPHSDYRLDQRRYMEPLPISRGGQTFYQAAPDVRNFPHSATSKQAAYPPPPPPPQPRPPQINQTGGGRKWGPPQQLPSSVQGPARTLNSRNGHPSIPSQNEHPKQQIHNHQSRRQGPGSRPQVRLPNIQQSNQPMNASHQSMPRNQDTCPIDFNSNVKTRTFSTASEFKDVRPRNSIRRHRSPTSNSSKTSIGSPPWEPTLPSTQSSSPDPSRNQTPPKSSSTPTQTPEDLDQEWLLLREESAKRPPPIEIDKYGHIPPLVRKWASVTVPEVRMGEPRWATSILSRKWEKEETWEKEKKELLAQKEQLGDDAPTPFRPVTCMTKEQDRANRIAELTLAMLHDTEDRDTNSRNIGMDENTPVEEKKTSIIV